jgi:hypothetical protein
MSITEQGPALPATLLHALQELLLGSSRGTGEASAAFPPPPWSTGEAFAAFPPRTLESRAPLRRYHIFLRAARKYNFR